MEAFILRTVCSLCSTYVHSSHCLVTLQQWRRRRCLAATCGHLAASPSRMPICSRCVRSQLWLAEMRAVFSATALRQALQRLGGLEASGCVQRGRPALPHGRPSAVARAWRCTTMWPVLHRLQAIAAVACTPPPLATTHDASEFFFLGGVGNGMAEHNVGGSCESCRERR